MRAAEVGMLTVGDLVRLRSGLCRGEQGRESDQIVLVGRIVSFDAAGRGGYALKTASGRRDGEAVVVEVVRRLDRGARAFKPCPQPAQPMMDRELLSPWDEQTETQWLATVAQQLDGSRAVAGR